MTLAAYVVLGLGVAVAVGVLIGIVKYVLSRSQEQRSQEQRSEQLRAGLRRVLMIIIAFLSVGLVARAQQVSDCKAIAVRWNAELGHTEASANAALSRLTLKTLMHRSALLTRDCPNTDDRDAVSLAGVFANQ